MEQRLFQLSLIRASSRNDVTIGPLAFLAGGHLAEVAIAIVFGLSKIAAMDFIE